VCGRFTQRFTWQELLDLYRLTQPPQNLRPSYNVCPTDPISVITPRDNGLLLMPMRWQLIPRWWKKSLKELSVKWAVAGGVSRLRLTSIHKQRSTWSLGNQYRLILCLDH
jgi:putative SOS response-associated peptidase YedK